MNLYKSYKCRKERRWERDEKSQWKGEGKEWVMPRDGGRNKEKDGGEERRERRPPKLDFFVYPTSCVTLDTFLNLSEVWQFPSGKVEARIVASTGSFLEIK